MVDAAILECQEAGQVGHRVVRAAGRQSEDAEQGDGQCRPYWWLVQQGEADWDYQGAEVTKEIHYMGPEDGVPPAKPVIREAPDETAQNIASPEGGVDQCRYPVLFSHPVILTGKWGNKKLQEILQDLMR